jgi:hypothetical protein
MSANQHHNFQKGDVVVSTHEGHPLHCGSGVYSHAIVVQAAPLVLVSEQADMRWQSTVDPSKLRKVAEADAAILNRCMKRL